MAGDTGTNRAQLEAAKLADSENSAGSADPEEVQSVSISQESIDAISEKLDSICTANVVLVFALFVSCGIAAVRTLLKSFEGF